MVVLLFIPYVVIKYEEMFMIVAMAMIMALEKRDICGVMLESNVRVYLIYMQCEFIFSSLIASLAHLIL